MAGAVLQSTDITGGTFYLVFVSMIGAGILFFVGFFWVSGKWKTPVALMCAMAAIAAVNYLEMRNVWIASAKTPIIYRYVDWTVTIPLQAVTLYFFIAAMAQVPVSLFWRLLVVSVVMELARFMSEAGLMTSTLGLLIGLAGWLYILGEIFFGRLSEANSNSGNESSQLAFFWLRLIVTIGWGIYPLSHFVASFAGGVDDGSLSIVYNLADFINKIAFGLIVLTAAVRNSAAAK
jgi:hypothetical protein